MYPFSLQPLTIMLASRRHFAGYPFYNKNYVYYPKDNLLNVLNTVSIGPDEFPEYTNEGLLRGSIEDVDKC